jgi:hypothetical protein
MMGNGHFKAVHRGWSIDCTPQSTADGRYAARAILHISTGEGEAEMPLTPPLEPFATAREAADAARDSAIKWIDDH